MTCKCTHTEEQHHPVTDECMVCECKKYKEAACKFEPKWYDE